MLVTELKEKEALTNKLAVEEFKSSEDFLEELEDSASRYFGEGFDFY